MRSRPELVAFSVKAVRPARFVAGLRVLLVILSGLATCVGCGGRADTDRLRREARDAAQAGRWEDAERALANLSAPELADWILRAQVALAREDTETGLACLENIPESGPSAAIRAYLLGKFELLRHRARAAEEALLEALRHDVDFVDAHRALVYLYGMQNRRQALWAQFEALAERGGLSAELVRHWCISHSAVGDPSEIPQDLERFVSADPTDVWSRLSLADAYRQLGKVEQAESALRGLDIANPDVRAVRAALAMSRGEISQAESLLADGPLDHPGLARLRGRLALARRHGAAAVGHFQAADAADPNDGETLVALSQALRLVGDTTQAEAIAQRAQAQQVLRNRLRELEEVPRLTPQNLCELGTRSEAAGFTAEARAWYRLAIAADPLNAEAQRALHRLGPAASTRHASAGTDGAD